MASRPPTGRSDFAGSSFEATLNEMKFLPSGEVRVVFVVPDSESANAVLLKDAYSCSLRVSVERLSHAKK